MFIRGLILDVVVREGFIENDWDEEMRGVEGELCKGKVLKEEIIYEKILG